MQILPYLTLFKASLIDIRDLDMASESSLRATVQPVFHFYTTTKCFMVQWPSPTHVQHLSDSEEMFVKPNVPGEALLPLAAT